jgi:hypothetical protein
MAEELGWSESETRKQVEEFRAVAANYVMKG